jgi:hypothetical protein
VEIWVEWGVGRVVEGGCGRAVDGMVRVIFVGGAIPYYYI